MTDRPQSRLQARLGRAYVTWRRFAANRLAVIGLLIILALIVLAVFAPLLAPHSPYVGDLAKSRLLSPDATHWLGTDDQGRDILSRLIYGSRLTLQVVLLVAIIAAPLGLLVGTVAGYAGGWVDAVLMRITDIFLAFPKLVLALAFVAALGPGDRAMPSSPLRITSWPPYARIARAETLTVRNSDYISAVRLMGASPWRIVLRHIMPLCISSLIVRVTLDMAGIILTAAGLGFLGLGAQPPLPEWGAMIASGRRFILDQWWVATMPGFAIFVVSLGFNLLGRWPARCAGSAQGAANERASRRASELRVTFPTRTGVVEAVRGVSASRSAENGSALSAKAARASRTTGRAIMGLTPEPGRDLGGKAAISTASISPWPRSAELRTAARPTHRHDPAGSEILAQSGHERSATRSSRRCRTCEPVQQGGSAQRERSTMLAAVQIRDPERVYDLYPHEVSGGMGQRAMIAMMLVAGPGSSDRRRTDIGAGRDRPDSRYSASSTELVADRGMGLIFISARSQAGVVRSATGSSSCMPGASSRNLRCLPAFRGRAPLYAGPAQLHAEDRSSTGIPCRFSTASRSGRYDRGSCHRRPQRRLRRFRRP